MHFHRVRAHRLATLVLAAVASSPVLANADELLPPKLVARPELHKPLTEPPCSYCSTQNRKKFVEGGDRVVAWIRGAHNGGAFPIRHFIAAPRVINDTYGLFFYDPDGGYVTAYKKDYGYRFHGWRGGVMVAQGPDGTLWSALSGVAFEGPKKGQRLERIASLTTTWEHWLMLHPESTAYDLFDGKKYPFAELPSEMSADAKASMGKVDPRLDPLALVIGVEAGGAAKAFPIEAARDRACYRGAIAGQPVAVLWYGPTQCAIAFAGTLDGKPLTLYADEISPETAPFKDRESGTRWTVAGRGVDGPHKGRELTWMPSVQCRWYAWASEYPGTELHAAAASD